MKQELIEMFKEHINFPEDQTEVCWYKSYDEIHYNTDNNIEDLMNGDGNTYSGEIRGAGVEINNLVMYTLDSQCGFDYQAIFNLELEVEEE